MLFSLCIDQFSLFTVTNEVPSVQSYGAGVGPIFLDQVNCEGTEARLLDCERLSHKGIVSGCDHSRDAGVRCPGMLIDDVVVLGVWSDLSVASYEFT